MPQRTIEFVAGVCPVEVVADVQDDLASPSFFDEADEVAELFHYLGWTWSGAAVTGQLEIDSWREGVALGSSDVEKMASLVSAGCAKCEVVVRASIKSCFPGSAPILIKAIIGEVSALGGLDVCERDAIVCDLSPMDDVLVSGHVDAVSLAFLQGWPPVRHPKEPPGSEHPSESGGGENPDKEPTSTSPGEPWRIALVRQG